MPLSRTRPLLGGLAAVALGSALALSGCGSDGTDPNGAGAQASEAPQMTGPVVWVAAEGDDALTLVDAGSGEVLTTITGLAAPHNVQATPEHDGVWATGTGGVVRIDASALAARGHAPSGEHPAHVVAGPGGSVWVTAAGDGVVHEHAPGLTGGRAHDIGGAPHGLRMAPDGSFAAIANTGAGTVDLLRLRDGHVSAGHAGHAGPHGGGLVRSVEVGPSPVQVAVAPDSTEVFVSVAGTSEVVRVDVASGEVTGRVTVSAAPAQIWVTSSGLLLSADQGTEEAPGAAVSVIDAATLEVLAEVPTGAGPHGIVVDAAEQHAWVTNSFDDSITQIDLDALTAERTVPVGDGPNGITLTDTLPHHYPAAVVELTLPARFAPSGHDHGSHEHGDPDHSGGHAH